MTESGGDVAQETIEDIFAEADNWHVNVGGETIHAKRVPGRWRRFKWFAAAIWIPFFLGPFLRWDDRQAVLFDIPERQFHILGTTILPQDFWMLSLVLLFFAILLLVVTVIAGRAWCGFFCFQTVWIDVFTWVEEKLEGPPQQRRRLDAAPMSSSKFGIKALKHAIWLVISALTGISFVAWFMDVYELYAGLFFFQLPPAAWSTILLFIAGTYILGGFMREQVCMWLCPYARIQGPMVDHSTMLPTYDVGRGEPRGRRQKEGEVSAPGAGDCVDCNQCVAVCPTGIDIRNGQQQGCIMCALCIDACDAVMDKLERPHGLVRWESLDGLNGKEARPFFLRTRVLASVLILFAAVAGIVYGLSTIDAIQLKVLHNRSPLFVLQSDGSIQNKYTLKILNKLTEDVEVRVSVTGPEGLVLVDADEPFIARHGKVMARTTFVRVPRENLSAESQPIIFRIETLGGGQTLASERKSIFMSPGP